MCNQRSIIVEFLTHRGCLTVKGRGRQRRGVVAVNAFGGDIMVDVRNLLSTLNSLAHAGLLATGRLRSSEDVSASGALPDPWQGDDVQGGVEPRLEDLLCDPVVRLMMQADHLEPEEVRRQLVSGRHADS
jgi:hypothetical protein